MSSWDSIINKDTPATTNMSSEGIIENLDKFDLNKPVRHLWADMKERLGNWYDTLTGLLSTYDSEELKRVLNDLKTGKIVPKATLDHDDIIKLNKLFGSAGLFNYKIGGDCKDLLEYINTGLELMNPDGTFVKQSGKVQYLLTRVSTLVPPSLEFIGKDDLSSKLFSRIRYRLNVDPKSNTFIMGLVVDYFNPKPSLMSVIAWNGMFGSKHAASSKDSPWLTVEADIVENPPEAVVSPATKDGLIRLLTRATTMDKELNKIAISMRAGGLIYTALLALGKTAATFLIPGVGMYATMFSDLARYARMLEGCMVINSKAYAYLDKRLVEAVRIFTERKK